MIYAGRNIKQVHDPLQKVDVDYLKRAIANPKPQIVSLIERLRQVQQISIDRYRTLKTELPYIVTATFVPAIRKKDNFASIQYFILDLDHLVERGFTCDGIKQKLSQDSQVKMIFSSPGGDGLKVLFCLSEPCDDSQKFTIFYKLFATYFGTLHQLDDVVDKKTCDVTRACFVSHDPNIFFRENCESVVMDRFVNFEDRETVGHIEKELAFEKCEADKQEKEKRTPVGDEMMQKIRERLNPSQKVRVKKTYFVPDEVEAIQETLLDRLQFMGFVVDQVASIQYGKKYYVSVGSKRGEVNLFYGKRGFTIVKTPKRGTDPDLNELVCRAIEEVVYG
ncbi:hypothetical protein K4L44_06610 [Halosquirtibacter laminarini]|uniref:Uncharacterized protein n=1 Tax=Halosquirtibacter laminarini TaxID=3374600 RepID=A0AC61NIE8_9BACT|nr:hypothetical protein K4L44_06610 [Prolixibacteraceae bacterium]